MHTKIQTLEKKFQFRFAANLCFESDAERAEIKARGLAHLAAGKVSAEALELGQVFSEQIQASFIPKVSVQYINDTIGYGLFLEENITEGSYVGEYTGIVRKNDRRYFEPLNNYCYEYPVPDDIGRNYVIDATKGHLTRFINHSDSPNLKPIHVFWIGFYHLIFLALRPLVKGTQLCFDYGRNYWYVRDRPEFLH